MKLKIVMGIMLTLLMASMVIVLAGKASLPLVIAQTNSTTTIYLDPPTINGTAIGVGNTVTVNLMIRDAVDISSWQAGVIFNATLLECTGFFEGEILSDAGPTLWMAGTINNTAGMVRPYCCILLGDYNASGDGRLAYATFKVKAPGVSDIHLLDVKVLDYDLNMVPVNIIDVYTVVLDTTSHKVVMVSNLTGATPEYVSGFYDHSFSIPAKKISFKVRGPHPGFSNVTIPKTLLSVSTLDEWRVKIDGKLLSTGDRIITENATHYSIYFTYSAGFHYVQITTRPLINSIISITLSSTFVIPGSDITISGDIDPMRPSVTVTILYRLSGRTFATLTTDPNSHYYYTWTPEEAGTYEFIAMWEGDDNTFGDVSDVKTLTVYADVVYIRADGSVEPDTAPISSDDNITYTFTDNIIDSIVVERDNIVVYGAGYTLQGTGNGTGIDLSDRNNVTIKKMKIKEFDYGIWLNMSSDNSIYGNHITNNNYSGIVLMYSSNNSVYENKLTANNGYGIGLGYSSNNTISCNNASNNQDGIYLVYYSSDNTVSGNTVSKNMGWAGIGIDTSNNNTVSGNTVSNNINGILLVYSNKNVVSGNTVSSDTILLYHSNNNAIFHNNFIKPYWVDSDESINTWDDGYPSGGNYWSNYTGVDVKSGPNQDQTGSDGIGDTAHVINEDNQDKYPLITTTIFARARKVGLFTRFGVVWEGETYCVDVISNSTIEKFQFKQSDKLITFNVTGPPGTIGYCNVTIPNDLLKGEPLTVLVDGSTPEPIITSNNTHTSLYFTYSHSQKTVEITGTDVIPEFPTWTSILLILIVLTVAIAIYKRRLPKTPIH